jgi:hypothetical protein
MEQQAVYERLVQAARAREFVHYGELAKMLGIDMDNSHFGALVGKVLGQISEDIERVRWLLETHADLPSENLLVLAYNVKARRELRDRIEMAVGPAPAARLTVSNVHGFRHRILREDASEADLPPNADVLDGVAPHPARTADTHA